MHGPEPQASEPVIVQLFVYGTLKRHECRGTMWPRKPQQVRVAYVQARLYDLGPYPSIRVDSIDETDDDLDWVEGEVWTFDPNDLPETIATLDEIEETNQPGVFNLYDHVLVRAFERPGPSHSVLALAYQYSCEHRLRHSRRLRPRDGESSVAWTAASDDS